MFKKIVLFSLFSSLIFGYSVEVKRDKVSLKINGKLKQFKVGDKFTLKSGDRICFMEGKGRVVIIGDNNYKKQLNRHTKKCKIMPSIKIKKHSSLNNLLDSQLSKSKENSVAGVSLMKSEEFNDTQQQNMLDIK